METSTRLSPQHYVHDLDTMASPDNHFLKLEDLNASSPSSSFDNSAAQGTPPPPVLVNSKPAKKRKSWGQELPEPKTMLPPRKRAKTDDEKEQRRIERIKRNRAAAHNSRERKRQETDTLAVALARANAELDAYRKLHGPLPSSVVLPEVMLTQFDDADTPAPSLIESRGSEAAASPASPALHDDLFSDNTAVTIKQEPDLTYPTLPQSIDLPEFTMKQGPALSLLDPTQHSAVSVEPAQQQLQPDNPFNFLVDPPLPAHHEHDLPNYLQDPSFGDLGTIAFAYGADDASFSNSLDFSFDEFIHDDTATSVPIDSGFGAA